MRESTAEVGDPASEPVKPGLAKIEPEWPMMGYMLNSELFQSYADSIVRLLGFAAQCEPSHPCLKDETEVFNRRGKELQEHIAQFKSTNLWSTAVGAAIQYVKRLALKRVLELEFDAELEEAVRSEIISLDLSFLKS